MHIVLLHQYHHNPDCPAACRHYDFMAHWARRHRVTVIGSDAWENKRITHDFPWVPDGVELISLHVPYDNKMPTWRRLRAFTSYARQASRVASTIRDADVIIGTSTPLTVAWAAERAARKLGIRWVFEVRDLWPDFPIEMGAIPNDHIVNWLKRKEEELYNSADHVITLSPDMSGHLRNKGVSPGRTSTVLQGSDIKAAERARSSGNFQRLRDDHGLGDADLVLYAGTFGRANDIVTLLKAAEELRTDPKVRFVFVGQGYHADLVEAGAQSLPNVMHVPPAPRHAVFDWFAASNLSIASFVDVPSVAASSPAKLFDALATGCPTIVTNAGWTKALVEEHACGWYSPAEDPTRLAETIRKALADRQALKHASRNAVLLAREQFDRLALADSFEDILVNLVAERSG